MVPVVVIIDLIQSLKYPFVLHKRLNFFYLRSNRKWPTCSHGHWPPAPSNSIFNSAHKVPFATSNACNRCPLLTGTCEISVKRIWIRGCLKSWESTFLRTSLKGGFLNQKSRLYRLYLEFSWPREVNRGLNKGPPNVTYISRWSLKPC